MKNLKLSTAQVAFLQHLTHLSPESSRGELAVLRRGLGSPPAEDVNMYRYVARYVPEDERNTFREKVYYLIAALYAYHPSKTEAGNFGQHMRQVVKNDQIEATERRFTVLLSAHQDELPDHLRQAVSFLKTKEEPVNWFQLFNDLLYWNSPRQTVQRQWANGFWRYAPHAEDTENQADNN